MPIKLDIEKGSKVAETLYNCFNTNGIHGHTDMPEDILPEGVEGGSLEHVLFITLTVSLDYMRDAPTLWECARKTFDDPDTNYLFHPDKVENISHDELIKDLQKYKLAKRPNQDFKIWITNSTTLNNDYNSNPLEFLEDCNWNSLEILKRLKSENFSYLGGNKIGPLWLRMLRDNVGISKLKKLEEVSIPVDVHVARASLATGVVYGEFKGRLDEIFNEIRNVWFESVEGLKINNRKMIALDIDEALWHLSKYGCSKRNDKTGKCRVFKQCEANKFCINGKIDINKDFLNLRTCKDAQI